MVDIHDSGILNKILLNDMIESFDGNIIVAGDLGVKNSPGTSRPFIMKIGPNGCFDSQCSHVDKWWYFPPDISSTSDNQDTPDRLKVNPNPGDVYKRQAGYSSYNMTADTSLFSEAALPMM